MLPVATASAATAFSKAFAELPGMIEKLSKAKIMKGASSSADGFAKMNQHTFTTGVYKKATDRTGILLGAKAATNFEDKFDAPYMYKVDNVLGQGIIGIGKGLKKGQDISGQSKGQIAASDADVAAGNAATTSQIDSGGNVIQHGALWTDAQKKERLGAAKTPIKAVDPYEGMDPKLRADMEAEDRRYAASQNPKKK